MIDLHRLRVFRAVVADGSINGAAATLGYTPSAVSQHLTTLQRETGLSLIERHGRGVVPTAVGRAIAHEAGRVLESMAEFESFVADVRDGHTGRLSVCYFASAGSAWIPPIIATITNEFPGLRIDLRLVELAVDATPDPDIEIFVEGSPLATSTEYDVHPLLEEPYVVVLPRGHRLAARSEVKVAELETERWVDNDVARGPCREATLTACAAAGFTPTFHIETHDYATGIRFVAEGVGITVLPVLGCGQLPPTVVAVPLVDPTPMRRIAVRTRATLRSNLAVHRVVELLRDHIEIGRMEAGFASAKPV